jgi:hypothetical protein
LQTAGLGALSLFWSDWLRASATGGAGEARPGRAKSVILIFNAGAPSHIDLWDPKPDAPDAIRGELSPIATSVPGVQVSELLPRMARHMHRLAVVRSVHHTHGGHNAGMYWSIVGKPYRTDGTLMNPSRTDLPSIGTLVGWLARRDGYSGAMPPYVITPAPHCDSTVYITPGQFGGCLGAQHDPLVLHADPNAPNFRVPNLALTADTPVARVDARRALLGRIAGPGGDRQRGAQPILQTFDVNHDKAFSLVTSQEVQRAFDLSLEPDRVRERYGRHTWGQSHLLARRLVEAGVRFVTTVNGPSIVWDTHSDNFRQLKTRLVPPMEMGFAALLDDLQDRGLLDSTLVVWMGDFGRTPRINPGAGRDHWPQCYTMVLAGGGIRGGQVYGSSDSQGAVPRTFPTAPADIHATMLTALGYDPHGIMYMSPEGRPFPLSEGTPIAALLS